MTKYFKPLEVFFHKFFAHLTRNQEDKPKTQVSRNCYDNAAMESFFHTLKTELVYLTNFETKQAAKTELFEYIEGFYNRERLHSTLGYVSPESFEANQ